MKKFTLLLSLLFAMVSVQAQDYLISFAGTGASATVGTVTVENLTQGKNISLLGSEVLHLVATGTGIKPVLDNENALRIYPNPTTGNSTVEFVANASGTTNIELFDITGRRIGASQNSLTIGTHSYLVSGLRSGIYTVRITSPAYTYTGKLVSNGAPGSDVRINYLGNSVIQGNAKMLKSASTETTMQYTTGDILKFTSISGNYKTISTDIPTQSKTITFPFVACTDADGNNYPVVKIGNKIWMAENLKTTKFIDRTSIPNVTDNTAWINLTSPGYCWYNNDATNKDTYGALYNWKTVNSGKLCPKGWHIPAGADWITLMTYTHLVDTISAGGKLKEKGTSHWLSPNTGATNETGFTALPGGFRNQTNGEFNAIGSSGRWWCTNFPSSNDQCMAINYNASNLYGDDYYKSRGFSVRCVYDYDPEVVTDIDGNLYHTVTIGTQVWMAENLKTTRYLNGDLIGTTTPATLDISGLPNPKYQWAYGGNESLVATYGRLYTWYAITDNRGICPTGWHVPTDAEWTTLTNYLGGDRIAGSKLKETGTSHWSGHNENSTNETGFTALPAGLRDFVGPFNEMYTAGYWWSSTEIEDNTANAWYRTITADIDRVYSMNDSYKAYGMSVRCLSDVTLAAVIPDIIYTINVSDITATTASSGGGFIISNGGATITTKGVCWSTNQTPTIADNKTIDDTGFESSYTGDYSESFKSKITGLSPNTKYYLRSYVTNSTGTGYGQQVSFTTAAAIETGTVTDIDGNVYKTVKIGDQWWMAENLKTTKYRDGTSIPNITDATAWTNLSTPGYCWYNNDVTIKSTYGALYNWYTVNTGKLAPVGWHVPTDAEWTILTTYLGGESVAGGKLKETGTSHWLSPNTGATNETGFTALPGGYRDYDGSCLSIGSYGYWWSSVGTYTAWSRDLNYDLSGMDSYTNYLSCGFSVRCVRD